MINLKRQAKKSVDNPEKQGYNVFSNPARRPRKEEKSRMTGQSKVQSYSLTDDRGIWVVRVRVLDGETETVKNRARSTGLKVKDKTKRKAQEMAKDIVARIEEELSQAQVGHDTTFAYYINGWLDGKDVTARANTARSYHDYATKHILPALGKYDVREITWRVLQNFYNGLLKTHKVNSVKKYDIVVSGALEDAIRDGVLEINPSKLVKWPKREKFEARAFSKEDAAKLLDIAERAGEPMRAAITLGLCYGLRREEVCGLRWVDIDFQQETMHIRHTVTQNGTVLLDDDHTKTTRSNRVISLIQNTIPYLRNLRDEQLKTGLPLDKVVAWPDGHNLRPDGITRMFKTLLRNNGMDTTMRFHELRHTAASMLASAGVPPKQLQAFLGHGDISITYDVYVHLANEDTIATSGKMDDILGQMAGCSGICSGSPKMVKLG